VSFGSTVVEEVLQLDFVTDTQVEIVARSGPDCEITVLTSYTAGEYWEATPERLAQATYYDSRTATVNIEGFVSEPPCTDVAEVVGAPRAPLRCEDAVYVQNSSTSEWQVLSMVSALAIASDAEGAPVMAVIRDVPGCEAVSVRRYDLQTVPEDGSDLACLADAQPGEPVAFALRGDDAMIWSGESVITSDDQGITWSPPE
jgi:hypothetical protein